MAAMSIFKRLTTRRPSTTASSNSTAKPTTARPVPMRQRNVVAASCTVSVVLDFISDAVACADCSRARIAVALSAAAPLRLSPTSSSLLAINARKRLSSAATSASTDAVETPIRTLPISTPLGLIEASR
ncbi:hypothetical protein D3C81_1743920 [compost metagenome]